MRPAASRVWAGVRTGRLCASPRSWIEPIAALPVAGWVRSTGALAGVLTGVFLLSGCGASIELPDLFEVQRSGSVPGARLTLVVNEGGSVQCNPHPGRAAGVTGQLSDPQLVLARSISEELQTPSAKHLALAPRPGSVFSYYVRDAEGTVRFADNSTGQPSALRHLAYLVLEVAQKVCRLPAG